MPVSNVAGPLPVGQRRGLLTAASLAVALLVGALSLAGLLLQETVYPSVELRQSFVANDLVTLLVGLPGLLAALWLAWRGRLIGLLFWPGVLFFVVYNAIAYVFALPAGWFFLLYLLLLALAVYTLNEIQFTSPIHLTRRETPPTAGEFLRVCAYHVSAGRPIVAYKTVAVRNRSCYA